MDLLLVDFCYSLTSGFVFGTRVADQIVEHLEVDTQVEEMDTVGLLVLDLLLLQLFDRADDGILVQNFVSFINHDDELLATCGFLDLVKVRPLDDLDSLVLSEWGVDIDGGVLVRAEMAGM